MTQSEHNRIWRRWSRERGLPWPSRNMLVMCWSAIGVQGRFVDPEHFEETISKDDGFIGEEIIFEMESNYN